MILDVRTMVSVVVLVRIIQIFIFGHQLITSKEQKDVKYWLMWSIFETLAFSVMFLRNIEQIFNLTVIFQNTMLLLASISLFSGTLFYFKMGLKKKAVVFSTIIYILLLTVFSFFKNDVQVRAFVTNTGLLIYYVLNGIILLQNARQGKKNLQLLLSITFFIYSAVLLMRVLTVLYSAYDLTNMFDSHPVNTLTIICLISFSIIWTYGYVILVNENVNKQLRESKSRFELIFNKSPDAVIISRISDGIIIDVNNYFSISSGYKKEEVVGKTTLSKPFYDDPPVRDKIIREISRCGFIDNVQTKFRRKDGSIITVLLSASKMKLNDVPHYISIVKDISNQITAQKALIENEEKFRQIFENSPSGILVVDLNKKFTACNSAFCDFIGYNEDELIGKTISDITHPEDQDIGMKELKMIVEEKLESCQLQKRYIRKDGKIVWGEISISLVRDTEKKPLFFLPVIQDISERKDSEEDLTKTVNELKQMNELMIDREIRMVELKKEINDLLRKEGKEPKY